MNKLNQLQEAHTNTGNRNTGDYNTGHYNTGNHNTGYRNTGYYNTGNRNTGYRNTGHYNTGDCNTGYRNTGDYNTGNHNTGYWNTGNRNTGYCNTTEQDTVRLFNKETNLKRCEILFPDFFYFKLTSWVYERDMSDKEKEAFPSYVTTGGYLKVKTYRGAWRESWNDADEEDRRKVLELPNFDNEVFKEISGIDVNRELNTSKRTVDDVLEGLSEEDRAIIKKALN